MEIYNRQELLGAVNALIASPNAHELFEALAALSPLAQRERMARRAWEGTAGGSDEGMDGRAAVSSGQCGVSGAVVPAAPAE